MPDERTRISVVEAKIVLDGCFELPGASEGSATELFLGKSGEETLDQIDPRSAGRREVKDEARPLGQPPFDQRCLVRAVVIQNQVNVQVMRRWYRGTVETRHCDAGDDTRR